MNLNDCVNFLQIRTGSSIFDNPSITRSILTSGVSFSQRGFTFLNNIVKRCPVVILFHSLIVFKVIEDSFGQSAAIVRSFSLHGLYHLILTSAYHCNRHSFLGVVIMSVTISIFPKLAHARTHARAYPVDGYPLSNVCTAFSNS